MTLRILVVLIATSGWASAQFPQQPPAVPRPVLSPYLNLLRRNNPAYLNYYGLVQPQIQAQNALNNLQQQVNVLQNTPQQGVYGGTGSELSTGKQVGFFTHQAYFLNGAGIGRQNYLTGQQGGGGSNSVYQPIQQQQQSPISPSSIMPFRR